MDYNIIYDFCKIRNHGTAMENGLEEYPPRVKFIIAFLEKMNIEYEVDTFLYKNTNLHNIYLRGTTNKWVMAHHDVCNHKIDNANDNSASVINAIGLKTLRPDINIALVDGEESPLMGAGSGHFAKRVMEKTIDVDWVLNLELTGSGGTNFFIGNYSTDLTNKIKDKFGCAVMNVPFNDATVMINKGGINAALINPCPLKNGEIIVEQIGILNDLLNTRREKKRSQLGNWFGIGKGKGSGDDDMEYLNTLDDDDFNEIMNDLTDDEYDEYEYSGSLPNRHKENKTPDVVDNKIEEVEEEGFNYGYWNLNIKDVKKGDVLTQSHYDNIMRELKQLKYSPKDQSERFVVKKSPIVLKPGEMPRLDQMETSILHRCHSSDDTVEHLRPEEMKDFVEKVLTVICEL